MHPFETKLSRSWPPTRWREVTVVVAVSGGADSVALLCAMAALKTTGTGHLVVAHLNHLLRGAEADADEAFVVELCRQRAIPCEVKRLEKNLTEQHGGNGLEAAARKARYAFFEHTALRLGARFVAVAHTADDQAETVLHRILRGTGVAGLTGIPRVRELTRSVTLIRPLLTFRRNESLAYLQSFNQPFRDDSSNRDFRFTRNRIREQLLPELTTQYNQRIVESLLRIVASAREVQSVIDSLVEPLLAQAIVVTNKSILVNCERLGTHPHYLVREVLKASWRRQSWPEQAMSREVWCRLADLVCISPGTSDVRRTFPNGVSAERRGGWLSLTPSDS